MMSTGRPPVIPLVTESQAGRLCYLVGLVADGVRRAFHGTEVDAGEILADDAQGEELRAGEEGDAGGRKREAGAPCWR